MAITVPLSIRRRWRRTFADLRFLLNRKSSRGTRRGVGLLLIILVSFFIWKDSQQPEDLRYVKPEQLSSTAIRARFHAARGGHGTNSRDSREWHGWDGVNAIFAFGDSYTDTGFNPNGPQPDEDNPLGNPAWPGRTASYGPNYVGHLVSTFRHHFISAYNFANRNSPFEPVVSGIDIRDIRAPLSFSQQIDMKFLRKYGTSTKMRATSKEGWGKWYQADSLFMVYSGSDDILQSFKARGGGQNETAARRHIEALELGLQKLYNAGARNFLILNYPSLEASPYARISNIPRSLFDLGADLVHHNGRLAFMAHRFAEQHSDANVFVLDQHALSLAVRREPTSFPETAMVEKFEGYCFPYAEERPAGQMAGLATKEVYDELCGVSMDKWFWRDESHHTEPMQRLLARKIVELLDDKSKRLPFEFY